MPKAKPKSRTEKSLESIDKSLRQLLELQLQPRESPLKRTNELLETLIGLQPREIVLDATSFTQKLDSILTQQTQALAKFQADTGAALMNTNAALMNTDAALRDLSSALRERKVEGLPVAEVGRYTGTDTTYQVLTRWIVGEHWGDLFNIKRGNLHRVRAACSASGDYDHAQLRLSINKPLLRRITLFEDKKIFSATPFQFPDNRLEAMDEVKLEVKSDDGTSISGVDGIICGREIVG